MSERERGHGFWVTGRGQGEIREEGLPNLSRGARADVLVRARMSAISAGTERLVLRGGVPKSQYQAMRCPFQAGSFPWPVKYGYAMVGSVENGPADLVGRRVFCLHPHQDRFVVPADAVLPVPDGVPDHRAALAANLETAINALWDAPPCVGDRVGVVGAGTVGLGVALLASGMPGVALGVVEADPRRAELARALGLTVVDAASFGECDLVLHASGQPAGLVRALAMAGAEATIVELSWFGDQPVALPLGEAFHAKRLRLVSSQVGRITGARQARWSNPRRLALALDLLADPRYDLLIGARVAFADLPAAMARLAHDVPTPPVTLIDYGSS
jgi:threonine dehydrogenase-like Zn-dependent dehydrogenase